MNRVAVVFFGPISKESELRNLSSYNNEIVFELEKRGVLSALYCKDFSLIDEVDKKKVKVFSRSVYSRGALLFYKLFGRVFRITERFVFESAFDWFVRINIQYDEFDILFLLRETNEKLCKTAAKKNKKIIGLMSIYPLAVEQAAVHREEQRWGITEYSNYTSRKRSESYDSIVKLWDAIIPLTSSNVSRKFISGLNLPVKVKFVQSEFGVDNELFLPKQTYTTKNFLKFLTTTDDTLKKGLPILMQAWSELPKEIHDRARLIVVGNVGANLKGLVDKYKELNISFEGYSTALHNYYRQADVFICASVIDMGPRTVKQAMSCGLPVIVSTQCGTAAFIEDYVNGFHFNIDNIADLVQKITYCVENIQHVNEMGRRSAEKSKLFSNAKFAYEIAELILNK